MPMIYGTAGTLSPQQLEGYSRDDIKNAVGLLEKQKSNLEKQREHRESAELDKRLANIEDRIKTLKTRINSADGGECQTCANRKYQDGSDDPGVSFKTASKVSGNAEAAVRGHEQEHVTRNRAKAEREGSEIVYQSVVIKHAICPECGSTYVSGGETTTVTKKTVTNDGKPVDGEDFDHPYNKIGADDENFGKNERDERFDVGLYDRVAMHGQLLNIVA